jgi:hypothetical protein
MATPLAAGPVPEDFEPLDMEELKLLPNDFKDKYMLLERLYGDRAWDLVKAWATQSADQQLTAILLAQNWDQTVYARGKRDAFLEVLNMEKGTNFQFRNVIREGLSRQASDEEAALARDEELNE